MADSGDIQYVKDSIESDYTSRGWSEEALIDRLDAGAIPERVICAYWRMRASATINLVNVSESGSSRGNDAIYSRMKALADDWDAKAKAIENPPDVVAALRGRLGSSPIKRV